MRNALYRILEGENPRTPAMRAAEICLIALIVLNVLAAVAETVDSVHGRFAALFGWFEAASVAVFTLEYAARVWTAAEDPARAGQRHPRLRYLASPLALIDLAAILPAYLGFLFVVDLRWLRLCRLLRLLKLARHWPALGLLYRVIRSESQIIGAALSVFCVIFVLASGVIYVVEHEAQPEAFGSIPSAMWWSVATLTAVGYGDVVPVTAWGKAFGGLVSLIGVGVVAFPAGILAAGFIEQIRGAGRASAGASAETAAPTAGSGNGPEAGGPRCPHCGKPLASPS